MLNNTNTAMLTLFLLYQKCHFYFSLNIKVVIGLSYLENDHPFQLYLIPISFKSSFMKDYQLKVITQPSGPPADHIKKKIHLLLPRSKLHPIFILALCQKLQNIK
jgi:hypothetical protein